MHANVSLANFKLPETGECLKMMEDDVTRDAFTRFKNSSTVQFIGNLKELEDGYAEDYIVPTLDRLEISISESASISSIQGDGLSRLGSATT